MKGMTDRSSKTFIAIALIIMICISAVACGRSTLSDLGLNDNSAASPEQQTDLGEGTTFAVETTAAGRPQTAPAEPNGQLLIWVPEADQDVWENSVLAAFQEKYPQVDIKIENYPPEDVASEIGIARLTGRAIPDLAVTRYRDIQSLIARDDLLDMTPWMEPHAAKISPQILDYCMDGDAFYCVPWHIGPTVLFYRRDIFEAAELPSDPESVSEMVATWDDFLVTCIEIRRRTGLLCMPYIYQSLLLDMMWQQGVGLLDQEGEINIDDPAVVSILEKFEEFRAARVIRKNEPGGEEWESDLSADLDAVDAPAVATIIHPSWLGHRLKNQFETKQEGNWGITFLPAWEEGGQRSAMGGGSAYVIPQESANPDAAWAFIEFMALNEENQLAQFAYSDYFPALNTTYDDPLFAQEDTFYGNQKTRQLFADVMNNVPEALIFGINDYSVIITELNSAVNNFFAGRMDAQQALQEAVQAVRLKLGVS